MSTPKNEWGLHLCFYKLEASTSGGNHREFHITQSRLRVGGVIKRALTSGLLGLEQSLFFIVTVLAGWKAHENSGMDQKKVPSTQSA